MPLGYLKSLAEGVLQQAVASQPAVEGVNHLEEGTPELAGGRYSQAALRSSDKSVWISWITARPGFFMAVRPRLCACPTSQVLTGNNDLKGRAMSGRRRYPLLTGLRTSRKASAHFGAATGHCHHVTLPISLVLEEL